MTDIQLDFNGILRSLQSRKELTELEMSNAVTCLLHGQVDQPSMVAFLEAMYCKGETAAELAGAASAMRSAMVTIKSSQHPVFDTCGTGGDGSKTFNISTAAAIVLAGAGCRVAKHGNRKVTSSTGSADVLAELGINLAAPPATAERCLNEVGMCFCFAPFFHPAMKHVAAARQQLQHPTVFNRLGPLCNPAQAEHQVIGVGDASLVAIMAQALQRLGTRRSIVVRGEDGVDEVSISGRTRVIEVTPHEIVEHWWAPEDFGVATQDRSGLHAEDAASSANCIRTVLRGEPGPCRDVVVINAAAALWLADSNRSLKDCAERACRSIDSGDALRVVQSLSSLTSL